MILDKKWDILILLDGCRYDSFEKYNPYKGKLTPFDIGCNGTRQYFQMNFNGRNCKDVVVVNHIIIFPEWVDISKFHKVADIYKTHWNYDYSVVLPEDNTEAALEQIEKHPDKRILIYYAQPHIPFLDRGTNLIKLKSHKQCSYKNEITGKLAKYLNSMKNIFPPIPFWYLEKVFGSNAGIGEIFFKEGFEGLKKSYDYNLIRTLKSLEDITKLNKKVVITSDHGKVIGEHLMFSHGWWKPKIVTTVP
jgi:hypothetical protein